MICQRCGGVYNPITGRHFSTDDNRCKDLINKDV